WNQERVYRSTNNGDNWIEITANLPITSDKPDIDIYNGKVFVVCQSEGVYYSANLGENWDIFSQESSAPGIFRLNLIGNYIYGTSMGEGAYRTNPDSSIWTPINNGFPRSTITCFYNYHNELYSGSPLDGLFRTSNSGGNWNRLGFSSGVSSITAVDSSLFVGTSVNEIFRSDNNGANWIFINDDFINNIHGTINLKAYQNKVFAGVWYIGAPFPIGGIFSSTDNGYNWSNLGIFNKVSSIAFKDSFIFISDYWTGVFRTSDEGQSWTNVNNGLGTPYTITLGVSQDYLFACTLDSGVFVSSNNGDTWIKKSAGLEGVIIQAIATIGDLIFIGTTSGVFSSSDFGDTWLDISSGLGDLNVYSLGISNSHLFAGTTSQGVWRFETPLPVELTFFNSILLNDKVLLNWNTATELNNYGFEIQRKQVFSSQLTVSNKDWQSVGFVFGNGTSNSPKSYSFTDEDLPSGKYSYRLKQIDNDGTFEYSNVVEITIGLPNKFILEQNFPNPFNPSTKISWQSPVSGHQTLKVYDVLGNEVTTLIDGFREAGNYTIDFNANKLSSGVYFYQLKAVEYIQTKKMILLR
ncbi:MAG: T9SS type A sorting domain-containing protein, partial [Ignavibacteriaceae bacterium]